MHPLFYAMLLFDRANAARRAAAARRARTRRPRTLKTWATIDPVGTRRVVVINKDPRKTDTVVLRVPGGADRARVAAPGSAPSITSTRSVTFGGRGYGDATFDGKLRGKPPTERAGRRNGAFRIDVPPAQRGAGDDLRRPLTGAALA